jgi:hypothetical protein
MTEGEEPAIERALRAGGWNGEAAVGRVAAHRRRVVEELPGAIERSRIAVGSR